ncbi:MAG: F0F1 ATP synthase subunit alpha, partial [Candidatus Omnitrophica bacterium]|nr:F0F1 ATP synthase subunit alpha [Candidatus Omnitrophota bacterium]
MATLRPEEVTSVLRRELEQYRTQLKQESVGTVLQVGDGIARLYGLNDVMAGELIEFQNGVVGMVLN